MRNWAGKVDQLSRVVETLQADPRLPASPDPALRPGPGRRRAQGRAPAPSGFRFHLRAGRLHMATTMRGQDVWIGMPYDVFFYTVLHELIAGWLDAELGEFRLHIGSLHIYDEHIEQADRSPRSRRARSCPTCEHPWNSFDGLLDQVEARDVTSHPGWDAMAETLCSYRLWKDGKREQAWRAADMIDGPLGQALTAWYGELERRSINRAATAGSKVTAAMKRTPSVILGLCSYTHDSSAALLVDGELVGFVEEECLSGQKHTKLYPARAVRWLLDLAKLSATDVDAVAYNFQPARYLADSPAALRMALSPMTRDRSLARAHGFARSPCRTRRRLRVLAASSPRPASHRSCTTEPTSSRPSRPPAGDKAAVLVVDSLGERQTTTIAHGHGIQRPASSPWKRSTTRPPSGTCTAPSPSTWAGGVATGRHRHGAGRSRRPRPLPTPVHYGGPDDGHGLPHPPLLLPGAHPHLGISEDVPAVRRRDLPRSGTRASRSPTSTETLAAALQERTEQVMVHLARRARALTGSRRLCVGGGVATNCVSIGKIIEAGIFDEVFVPPAPGTLEPRSGPPSPCTSMGAALARSRASPATVTSAPSYEDQPLDLTPWSGLHQKTLGVETAEFLADQLAHGVIAGLFQGVGVEAGPRALGSPLDPRLPAGARRRRAAQRHREVPRAVPALRPHGSRRARRRVLHPRPAGPVHVHGLRGD